MNSGLGGSCGRALLSTLLLLALIRPASGQTNLVPNPSLEQPAPDAPERPASWSSNSWGGVSAAFQYPNEGYQGTRSVRVEVSAVSGEPGDAKWWSEPFAVKGGTYYRVGDVYRGSAPSALLLRALGAAGEEQWLTVRDLPAATSWTPAEATLRLPDFAVQVQLAHILDAVGWLQTDSYSMTPDAPPTPLDGGGQPDAQPSSPDSGGGGRRALVSVAFDDGWLSSYVHAVPILQELGIRASHYIVAGWVDKPGYQSDYMTSEQLQELVWQGHELGSHSSYHKDLTTLPDRELQADIFESKSILEGLGFSITGFVPPGGAIDERGRELVEQRFGYLRTVEAGLNFRPFNLFGLRCVVVLNSTELSEIADWVEQAAAQEGWLILLYHRLSREAPADTFVTPARFREDMTYLAQSGALLLPVGEVLQLWKPTPPPPPVQTGKSLPGPDLRRQEEGCSISDADARARPASALLLAALLSLLLGARARRD